MKGQYRRFMERHTSRSYSKSMNIYEQTMDYLSNALGDGNNYRQDEREMNIRLKPNESLCRQGT